MFTLLCVVRFAEVAEAEVVEGDLGEEADSVEIRTEDYNSKGEKMWTGSSRLPYFDHQLLLIVQSNQIKMS